MVHTRKGTAVNAQYYSFFVYWQDCYMKVIYIAYLIFYDSETCALKRFTYLLHILVYMHVKLIFLRCILLDGMTLKYVRECHISHNDIEL